jgi:hypothetical protein
MSETYTEHQPKSDEPNLNQENFSLMINSLGISGNSERETTRSVEHGSC